MRIVGEDAAERGDTPAAVMLEVRAVMLGQPHKVGIEPLLGAVATEARPRQWAYFRRRPQASLASSVAVIRHGFQDGEYKGGPFGKTAWGGPSPLNMDAADH